ncbi:hypothetical protein MP638_003412, partial [Amoeboaphelidium occidentale]
MNTLFTALTLLLALIGSSLAVDKTDVVFLQANMSFTMRDFGGSARPVTTEHPLISSNIKGFGKWKFAIVQNGVTGGNREIIIKIHCAEDCPSDNSTAVTWMDIRFSNEGQEIFKSAASVHHITWQKWRNPEMSISVDYDALSEKPYGKPVTVSINLYTTKPEGYDLEPEGYDLEVRTETARLKYSDACMRSMLSNEKLVTLHFKDGNLSTYPSFLMEHSVVLKDFLEMKDSSQESVLLDFKKFPKQTGAMLLEVFCYEKVMT